jgi:hypothetical protein
MKGLNKIKGLFYEPVTGETFDFTFTNADLVDGELIVVHNLGTSNPKPLLRRPDDTYEDAIGIMEYIDTNNIKFNFGPGDIDTGTWIGEIKE